MRAALLAIVLAVTAGACGSSEGDSDPGPFDVSNYDRGCTVVDDCVRIFSGDPCGCSCDQVAIAASAQARYFADRDAYMEQACPGGAVVCGACAAAQAPECTDGQCVLPP